jgi:hypothetical protein
MANKSIIDTNIRVNIMEATTLKIDRVVAREIIGKVNEITLVLGVAEIEGEEMVSEEDTVVMVIESDLTVLMVSRNLSN